MMVGGKGGYPIFGYVDADMEEEAEKKEETDAASSSAAREETGEVSSSTPHEVDV